MWKGQICAAEVKKEVQGGKLEEGYIEVYEVQP